MWAEWRAIRITAELLKTQPQSYAELVWHEFNEELYLRWLRQIGRSHREVLLNEWVGVDVALLEQKRKQSNTGKMSSTNSSGQPHGTSSNFVGA
jgi:hypothetical protein